MNTDETRIIQRPPRRPLVLVVGCAAIVGLLGLIAHGEDGVSADAVARKYGFSDNVHVSVSNECLVVESDGIPNHQTAEYPNKDNPNRILKQSYRFVIPLKPHVSEKPVRTPMGPIGVALNGIPFYNQYTGEGKDAVRTEVFDSCCGHPDMRGRYHYHKYPVCVKSPFKDPKGEHSPVIGYAFDGFPICGPNGDDGKPPTNLDECNGHTDEERGYHYHVTAGYPYVIGAYHGEPEKSNLDHGGGRGGHPPGGRRRPPPPPGAPPPPDE